MESTITNMITANQARAIQAENIDKTKEIEEEYKKQISSYFNSILNYVYEEIMREAKNGRSYITITKELKVGDYNYNQHGKTIAAMIYNELTKFGYKARTSYNCHYLVMYISWG